MSLFPEKPGCPLVFAAATLFCSLAACSIQPKRPPFPVPASYTLSLEDVLQVPLAEGESGRQRIAASLFEVARYPHAPGTVIGANILRSPITLADGYRLIGIFDYTKIDNFSIDVAQEPCFSVNSAGELTGARRVQVIHGYTNYDVYSIIKAGIELSFTASPPRIKCVSSISIGLVLPLNEPP